MNPDFVTGSSFYKELLAEKEEILKLKWIESEKVSKDIGFDKALFMWLRLHRSDWAKSRYKIDK